MDELLKKLLEAELAKLTSEEAKKAETPAPAPQAPALDVAALVEALKPALVEVVEAEVQKALPARQEGVGPKGEQAPQVNPLDELVKKASTPGAQLTPAEKNAIWKMTAAAIGKGLKS